MSLQKLLILLILSIFFISDLSMGFQSHRESVVDRLLRYVRINTQSKEGVDSIPSTPNQMVFARLLVEELQQLGVGDAHVDNHSYVYGTIPSNLPERDRAKVPSIGFISHLDTSPEVSGDRISPVIHHTYQGKDIFLPADSTQVITTNENPRLHDNIGSDIITADGTTLLGADDKAGIAEIMTAVQKLLSDSTIHHGTVKIAFTPDEEVDNGGTYFDIQGFGAQYAYTVDGGQTGEVSNETWNADEAIATFRGNNTHPGNAKGKMINSLYMVSDFISRLPENLKPETTEKRAGFLHPYTGTLDVGESRIRILLRSFDTSGLTKQHHILLDLCKQTMEKFPFGKIDIDFRESYRNMKLKLDKVPFVTQYALEACRDAGLQPLLIPIRGGTDGSDLTGKGLPCPNLFTGGENFHSKLEWIPVRGMEKAVETIVNLITIWTKKSLPPK
jgi:tripeptide aminopeptidase